MDQASHILIAEDSPTQAAGLKHVLEEHKYRVVVTKNGKEAFALAQSDRPTLIISDIVMPEMNGYELCRKIKADESLKDIPVILLTDMTDPRNVIQGLEAGANNFIEKPYEDQLLITRVHQVLEKKKKEHGKDGHDVTILFGGEEFQIKAAKQQIVDFLVSTYEAAVQKNQELIKARDELRSLNERLEEKVEKRTSALRAEILERIKAEEQIREQAALLDKAQDAIRVVDLEGKIIYWNKSSELLYGWPSIEILGKSAKELLYKQESWEKYKEWREVLVKKGEWAGEVTQLTRDGKEIIVESRWTLVHDHAGKPKSILAINTDITEKKSLQQQFFRAQRLESIGTLAGGIAHDLNNVLTPIILSAQILGRKLTDEKSQHVLAMLEASAKRGVAMVKQVLAFGRGMEGEPTVLRPKELVLEMQTIARETFPKSIQIASKIDPNIYTISADATQVHQILLNLCVNARDAMPNGGTLSISGENVVLDENYARMHLEAKAGPYVLFKVSDTGTGMPPELTEKIFDPFFTTKEVGKGTGLGLSTVLMIVKEHGGFMNVYSELGKGTQFKVYLPAIPSTETVLGETERTNLPNGRGELVLVVDNEASIRSITKETLELYGYRAMTAIDGTEAVALFAQNGKEISVVIVDMMMPFMDGAATIRALRRIDPNVKIIAASGLPENGKVVQAKGLDVQWFLPKPFTAQKLLMMLDEGLRGKEEIT